MIKKYDKILNKAAGVMLSVVKTKQKT